MLKNISHAQKRSALRKVKKVPKHVKSHFHCGKSDVLSKKHFHKLLKLLKKEKVLGVEQQAAPLAAAQLKSSTC